MNSDRNDDLFNNDMQNLSPQRNYCVVAIFDMESEKKIHCMQRLSGREEDLSAHITIANFPIIDELTVSRYTEEFSKTRCVFSVDFISIAFFDSTCSYLLPRYNNELLTLYSDYHLNLDYLCDEFTSCSGNKWQPHTTLAHRPTPQTIQKLVAEFSEFSAKIVGLRIKDCENNYRVVSSYYFN